MRTNAPMRAAYRDLMEAHPRATLDRAAAEMLLDDVDELLDRGLFQSMTGRAAPRKRDRDVVWAAIVKIWWGAAEPTSGDRPRLGRLTREFMAKGATADEMAIRLQRYKREWPKAAATPEALLKHWGQFAAGKAVEKWKPPSTQSSS